MNGPQKFRKRPIEITAIQWTGDNAVEVGQFMGSSPVITAAPGDGALGVRMRTVHGETAYARPGDWITADATPGTFHPIAGSVLDATYEHLEAE